MVWVQEPGARAGRGAREDIGGELGYYVFLLNSSSGLPPVFSAGKSMHSDSVISHGASPGVRRAVGGDISGHGSLNSFFYFFSFPAKEFIGISQPLHAFVKTLICVCANLLMADAGACESHLHSVLVMAWNVPLIMHLWNSAAREPSNYPTIAFPASVSSQLGLH